MSDYFEDLRNQNWKELILKTTDFTLNRLRYNILSTGSNRFPIGSTAKDIAFTAIELTFDGTRKWNPDVYPVLFDHLISTINSLISAHFQSYEKDNKVETHSHDDDKEDKNSKEFFVDDGDIIGDLENHEIEKYFYDAVKNDDKLTELLMLIQIGNSREEISKQLNIKISDIDNLKKRLRRTIKNYLEKEGLFHELK